MNKPQYDRFDGPSYKVLEATRVHSSNSLIEGKNIRAAEEPLARFHHNEDYSVISTVLFTCHL
jgi:hypothetical protein